MSSKVELLKIYPESFMVNLYSVKPFRMIGLIDVKVKYIYGTERVTLAFYRSSGTNGGKIKGLWYPIVGIKLYEGRFTEFTDLINFILTNTTKAGRAKSGWLAKSIFFSHHYSENSKIRGFSYGKHYKFLLETGKALRNMYENDNYNYMKSLDARNLNHILTSNDIFPNNTHTQRENYERFIENVFQEH